MTRRPVILPLAGLLPLAELPTDSVMQSPERAVTMFLVLFMTTLVGLYMAVRHLKRSRSRFWGELRSEAPKVERHPELEGVEAYMVSQGQQKALKVFRRELKEGHRGLCISRTFPAKLQESWDLEGADLYWLANGHTAEEGALATLEDLSQHVERFLTEDAEEKGVILLDGVEYLFVQNSFTEVMKLLQDLKDAMPSHGGKLLLPIDLLSLVERQRALLTREFRQI